MPSRMDRYYNNNQNTQNSRARRNSSLYEDIYDGVEYSNVEGIATIEKKNEQHINEEYILKSENNRLVVYKKGENTPYKVTDTVTDRLPHSDILRLEKGITVTGTVNLRKALEDYCS